ncbi:regulatory protein RecX [Zhihengliuella flava]|uniref:Regulatory protein RecX n=1 Tax=Zhihengliuella flava TaxID=1285193 RepID=A0A931D817_9MICC|nr:regulatory protein RecX [Zhihengliuella flava]MBG6083772.1 SOS response regulatory protein OraA/RecX [Zhihengliuella flava]
MARRDQRTVTGVSPDAEEWLSSAGPPPDWAVHPDDDPVVAAPDQVPAAATQADAGHAPVETSNPDDVRHLLAEKISQIEQSPPPRSDAPRRRSERRGAGRRGAVTASSASAEPTDAELTEQARAIVLRQLTGAAKSRHQLTVKLRERDIPAHVASSLLDRFEELGLVDDRDFATQWVRSRAATKRLSASALKRELITKGIDPDFIEEALEQVSEDDERAAARELIDKKLRTQHGIDWTDRGQRDKVTRRLVSLLARRGYGGGLAFSLVAEAIDEARAAPQD